MKDTASLISSLVAVVGDYGGMAFNDKHVQRWLDQFPEEHHKVILKELGSIMDKAYLSKKETKRMISEVAADRNVFSEGLEKARFMDTNQGAGTQQELLQLFDETISEAHGISIEECGQGESSSYIYVDEAIWSGEQFIDGLRTWVRDFDDLHDISRMDIIVLAVHTRDLDDIRRQMGRILPYTRISLWHFIEFENGLQHAKEVFEGYWPSSGLGYNEETTDYISRIVKMKSRTREKEVPILRKSGHPKSDAYFTGAMNRKLVERLFLEKGVEIVNHMKKPEIYMKPMGYDAARTLGFGSYFISYMGISKHCPLVLWWEDEGWYPLFPRNEI